MFDAKCCDGERESPLEIQCICSCHPQPAARPTADKEAALGSELDEKFSSNSRYANYRP